MTKSRWLPALLVGLAALVVALLVGAYAGWTVAVFLALTVLAGGLAVMAINASP